MIVRKSLWRRSRSSAPPLSSIATRSFIQGLSTEQNTSQSGGSSEISPIESLPQTQPETPPLPPPRSNVAEAFHNFKEFKSTTGKLGTTVGPHYKPHLLVNNAPRPQDITLELLLASGAHLGHATSLWNPSNQRYIFGIRQGIHIISLEQIAAHLRRASKIVQGVAAAGGTILFVGTRAGQERAVVQAAKNSGGCHLFEKWIPGTITNGQRIVGNGAVVEKDFRDKVNPVSVKDPTALKPDLVVCLNPLENYVLLHECGLYAIPTIGIVDTDADPTCVTYPIPANDDSLRAVNLIVGVLGRAGEAGRKMRIKRAEQQLLEL